MSSVLVYFLAFADTTHFNKMLFVYVSWCYLRCQDGEGQYCTGTCNNGAYSGPCTPN